MSLEDFDPETQVETVPFKGGSFTVRAISLPDVAMLIDIHEYAITMIIERFRRPVEISGGEDDDEAVSQVITSLMTDLIRESPILVCNLIAICADSPLLSEKVAKLPVTVQIDAVNKIAKLTFTDLASVKKLYADVMSMVAGLLPQDVTEALGKKRKKN